MEEIEPRPKTSLHKAHTPMRTSTADPVHSPRRPKHHTDFLTSCPYRQSIDLPVRIIKDRLRAGRLREGVRRSLGRLEEGKKGRADRTRLKDLHQENQKLSSKLRKMNETHSRLENELTQLKEWSGRARIITNSESPPQSPGPASTHRLVALKTKFQGLQREYEETKKQESALEHAITTHRNWVQPSFQAALERAQSKRLTSELFPALWQALLQALDGRQVKQELGSLLRGKRREEVVDWVTGLKPDFTKAEVSLLLGDCFTGDYIRSADFIGKLKEYQPYPLFEDLEALIPAIQLHFALQDYSKSKLIKELSVHSEFGRSQNKAKSVLKAKPFSLQAEVAEVLVGYLFKGKETLRRQADMLKEIETWEVLRDVKRRVRREFALKDIPLEAVEDQFPPNSSLSSVQQYCTSTLNLSDAQTGLLCSAIDSPFPVLKLVLLLGAAYPTFSTAKVAECFQKLSESTSQCQLYAIGLRTPAASPSCLYLKPFLADFQRECSLELSKRERWAIKLYLYRDTRLLNAFRFTSFVERICLVSMQPDASGFCPAPAQREEQDEL